MTLPVSEIQAKVAAQRDTIVNFMREICAIPSMESQIGPVGERIQTEMKKLGYDEVRFDKMGNTIGRIGNGPRVLVYDSHIDTVGIGDPAVQLDGVVGRQAVVGDVQDRHWSVLPSNRGSAGETALTRSF